MRHKKRAQVAWDKVIDQMNEALFKLLREVVETFLTTFGPDEKQEIASALRRIIPNDEAPDPKDLEITSAIWTVLSGDLKAKLIEFSKRGLPDEMGFPNFLLLVGEPSAMKEGLGTNFGDETRVTTETDM